MSGLIVKLRLWWESSDRSQRMLAIGGSIFLVILLAGTLVFASRPRMALLFGGLSPQEQGSVVEELTKDGFQPDYNERGDVSVPSDKVTDARVKLATANKLPTTTGFGDDELAKLGIMNTPPVERERLKGMLEGKLAESIQAIDGIASARVHLVLGEESAFVREEKPATGSVTITERAGGTISKEQGRVIATLVANSVPGLSMANVAVLNNKMEMLYDGQDSTSVGGGIEQKLVAEQAEGRRRERELQSMLDRVYGPETTVAKINLELDFDDRKTTKDLNTPSQKLPTETIVETMDGGRAPAGGAAGTTANAPAANDLNAAGAQTKGGGYSVTQKMNDYMRDTTHTEVKESAGTLKTMAIDVIANSDKVTNLAEVEGIVDGYLGSKVGEAGFTKKVSLVKFDSTVAKASSDAATASAGQQRMQQIFSLLPIVALIVVAIMVVRQIGKLGRYQPVLMATDAGPMAMGYRGPASLPARAAGESPADYLANVVARVEDEDESDIAGIKGISRKINVPLEQIKKMSTDRPEAVAMLIKGWLLEERK